METYMFLCKCVHESTACFHVHVLLQLVLTSDPHWKRVHWSQVPTLTCIEKVDTSFCVLFASASLRGPASFCSRKERNIREREGSTSFMRKKSTVCCGNLRENLSTGFLNGLPNCGRGTQGHVTGSAHVKTGNTYRHYMGPSLTPTMFDFLSVVKGIP